MICFELKQFTSNVFKLIPNNNNVLICFTYIIIVIEYFIEFCPFNKGWYYKFDIFLECFAHLFFSFDIK